MRWKHTVACHFSGPFNPSRTGVLQLKPDTIVCVGRETRPVHPRMKLSGRYTSAEPSQSARRKFLLLLLFFFLQLLAVQNYGLRGVCALLHYTSTTSDPNFLSRFSVEQVVRARNVSRPIIFIRNRTELCAEECFPFSLKTKKIFQNSTGSYW